MTEAADIVETLKARGFLAPDATPQLQSLPGGVSSDVFRLDTAQGTVCVKRALAQLRVASQTYQYGLQLQEVARIWRGGCIIRAACLEDIRQAYDRNGELPNLLLDPKIGGDLSQRQQEVRRVLKTAIDRGIPMPAFMSTLAYFDAYRSETLPTNLIQAQRDYFGAHTYERIDREGIFHTQW